MTSLEESRPSISDRQRRRSSYLEKSRKSLEEQAAQQKLKENEEKRQHLKTVLNNINQKELEHQDERDVSLEPSFSKFQLPYTIKCRNRYNATKKLYEQRFQYEIEHLIAQQPTGYEAARLNSVSEIVHTQRYFFSLTRKGRQRLNWIMSTKII